MFERDFVEVNQVIKHMESEDVKKIPKSFLQNIEDNMDLNYQFIYDESKKLNEQQLSENSRLIISLMYMRYLATEDDKKRYYNMLLEDKKLDAESILQGEKIFEANKKHYEKNVQISQNGSENTDIQKYNHENLQMIQKQEKWYKRIFEKVKRLFNFFK